MEKESFKMLKINYDYHSTIKKLVNEFEGQFECLGEKKKKYKTFYVPIKIEIT